MAIWPIASAAAALLTTPKLSDKIILRNVPRRRAQAHSRTIFEILLSANSFWHNRQLLKDALEGEAIVFWYMA